MNPQNTNIPSKSAPTNNNQNAPKAPYITDQKIKKVSKDENKQDGIRTSNTPNLIYRKEINPRASSSIMSSHQTESEVGSTSSKISSSIAGPIETQESMTFALSELYNLECLSMINSEDSIDQNTAQFRLLECGLIKSLEENRGELIMPKQAQATPRNGNVPTSMPKSPINQSMAGLLKNGWKSFAQGMQSRILTSASSAKDENRTFKAASYKSSNVTLVQPVVRTNTNPTEEIRERVPQQARNHSNSSLQPGLQLIQRNTSLVREEARQNTKQGKEDVQQNRHGSGLLNDTRPQVKPPMPPSKDYLKPPKMVMADLENLPPANYKPYVAPQNMTNKLGVGQNNVLQRKPLAVISNGNQRNVHEEKDLNKSPLRPPVHASPPKQDKSKSIEIRGLNTTGRIIKPELKANLSNSARQIPSNFESRIAYPSAVFPMKNQLKRLEHTPINGLQCHTNINQVTSPFDKQFLRKTSHLTSKLPVIPEDPEIKRDDLECHITPNNSTGQKIDVETKVHSNPIENVNVGSKLKQRGQLLSDEEESSEEEEDDEDTSEEDDGSIGDDEGETDGEEEEEEDSDETSSSFEDGSETDESSLHEGEHKGGLEAVEEVSTQKEDSQFNDDDDGPMGTIEGGIHETEQVLNLGRQTVQSNAEQKQANFYKNRIMEAIREKTMDKRIKVEVNNPKIPLQNDAYDDDDDEEEEEYSGDSSNQEGDDGDDEEEYSYEEGSESQRSLDEEEQKGEPRFQRRLNFDSTSTLKGGMNENKKNFHQLIEQGTVQNKALEYLFEDEAHEQNPANSNERHIEECTYLISPTY